MSFQFKDILLKVLVPNISMLPHLYLILFNPIPLEIHSMMLVQGTHCVHSASNSHNNASHPSSNASKPLNSACHPPSNSTLD